MTDLIVREMGLVKNQPLDHNLAAVRSKLAGGIAFDGQNYLQAMTRSSCLRPSQKIASKAIFAFTASHTIIAKLAENFSSATD